MLCKFCIFAQPNRKTMATVSAFVRATNEKKDRESVVRFRLTDGRDVQLFYKSDLKILPRLWSKATQSIKNKVSYDEAERVAFNRKVEDIKHRIAEWYISQPNPRELTSADLEEYMARQVEVKQIAPPNGFAALYDLFLESRNCTRRRIDQLRVAKHAVQRYEVYMSHTRGERYVFDIHTVTQQTLRAFERFMTDEHKIATLYPELYQNSQKIKPRGYNTIRNRLIFLRSFFIWLRENELTTNAPFKHYKIGKAVYGTAIYITKAELNHLATLQLPPALEKYRDFYIFQSSIGLRVSDLMALCGRNIHRGAVEYIAQKTSREEPKTVRVPMNMLATAIYEKYKKEDPNERLFPISHSQVYNRNLKKIFALAGLDRWVQRPNPVTREPEQVRLCDIVGSHMARKTFIGNIYKEVRDQNLVSELTGHKPNSEAFLAYRDVDEEMRRDMVAILDS